MIFFWYFKKLPFSPYIPFYPEFTPTGAYGFFGYISVYSEMLAKMNHHPLPNKQPWLVTYSLKICLFNLFIQNSGINLS